MKKIAAEWVEKAEGDFKVALRESDADDAVSGHHHRVCDTNLVAAER